MPLIYKKPHLELGHSCHTDMTKECTRLKVMTRKVGVRISTTIQECDSCATRGEILEQEERRIRMDSTLVSL